MIVHYDTTPPLYRTLNNKVHHIVVDHFLTIIVSSYGLFGRKSLSISLADNKLTESEIVKQPKVQKVQNLINK